MCIRDRIGTNRLNITEQDLLKPFDLIASLTLNSRFKVTENFYINFDYRYGFGLMDIENTKLPPNSIDSEQSVLGGLLLHNDSWDRVVNILSTDDFYQASHRIIYDAIVTLLEHDKPADILTVKEQVIKTHDEDSIGGFTYLAQIADNTPTVSNIETYAKHVRELSVYRQLIKIGREIADTAFQP